MPSRSGRRQRHRSSGSSGSAAKSGPPIGHIRIIAGQWRGCRLPVVDAPGLRPSGDRLRETLFNWLQSHIAGARCLDLFAGTGALGFEALSRYAQSAVFVEPNPQVRECLLTSSRTLGLEPAVTETEHTDNLPENQEQAVTVIAGTAAEFIARTTGKFDVVFIDPPFEMAVQNEILEQLILHKVVNDALIYVETPAIQPLQNLPERYSVLKEKRIGDVSARLLRCADNPKPYL